MGGDGSGLGIRQITPGTNLLGLTATPTYTDETRRGWLGKIFEAGIIYQADKADITWFQCVYLKTKLCEKGIRADAVYSHIDADPGSAEARNQRTADDNGRILNEFKAGKDASGRDMLDVLINVRMLTEGTDAPTVRTVFLTRQTTSPILMAQMIGRALRGKKAGGDDEANIVMFIPESTDKHYQNCK